MPDVQLEKGYTRIANELLEALAQTPLNGTQWRILMVIFRYTYGFKKKEAELPLSFISKVTRVSKCQVSREITKLINCNIVTVTKQAYFNSKRLLSLNKDYLNWQQLTDCTTVIETVNETVDGLDNETVDGLVNDPIYKENNKENIKKTYTPKKNKPTENDLIKFTEFYSLYPKKKGKQEALKAWNKILPDDELFKKIIENVKQGIMSKEWQKENGQFIPNPATYLNGKRWDDEYTVNKAEEKSKNKELAEEAQKFWMDKLARGDMD